jgi:hypothetical protein
MSDGKFSVPSDRPDDREEAAMPYRSGSEASSADTLTRERQSTLMAIEGVEGVGTGQDAIGHEAIVVYVRDQEAAKRVPAILDGMKIIVQITGPIDALKG